MKEYAKIQSIYKRDEKTHKFIEGDWSLPEFEYLKDNIWVMTEKVDGTNIRVIWTPEKLHDLGSQGSSAKIEFRGKTDNAQIPVFLLDKLVQLFSPEGMKAVFGETDICLYGEGYGAKIQKGGGKYISNGVNFVLTDVLIDGWWLRRDNIEDIAQKLGIRVVPVVREGTLEEAVSLVKSQTLLSRFGAQDFLMEGLVLKPKIELRNRRGNRVITKLKHKDFLV